MKHLIRFLCPEMKHGLSVAEVHHIIHQTKSTHFYQVIVLSIFLHYQTHFNGSVWGEINLKFFFFLLAQHPRHTKIQGLKVNQLHLSNYNSEVRK